MNSFLKKVKGLFCGNSTPEHETLENFVNQQVQSLFSSPKTSEETFLYAQVFSKLPLQLEETRKIIINELNRVFLEKTTDRQKINLRKLTLETSKTHILNTIYRSRVEADRRILNEKIFVGQPFETAEAFALISVASAEIELLVYRIAQDLFFNDAKPNDYFSIFQKACRTNTNLIFDGVIAEKKGDVFAMQPVLKVSTDLIEKIEQDALEGKDLIYENVGG